MISRHFRDKDNEYLEFNIDTTSSWTVTPRFYINHPIMIISTKHRIDWGDGSSMEPIDGSGVVSHTYNATASYTLRLWTREKYKNIDRISFESNMRFDSLDLSQWEYLYNMSGPTVGKVGTFSMPLQYKGNNALNLSWNVISGQLSDPNGILDLTPWESYSGLFLFAGTLLQSIKRIKINQNNGTFGSNGFRIYDAPIYSIGPSASDLSNRTLDFTGLNITNYLTVSNLVGSSDVFNEIILPSSAFSPSGVNEVRFQHGSFSSIDISNINWTTSNSKQLWLIGNTLLSTIVSTPSISGRFNTIYTYGCPLLTDLDLTPYELSTNTQLYLSNNNPLLTSLTFSSSTYSTIRLLYFFNTGLSTAPNFTDIPNATEVNNSNINFSSGSLDATNVNKILVDLDTNSTNAFTGRLISLAGNAAPDGTSGGFDGTTAKANLITKGFTVTTA